LGLGCATLFLRIEQIGEQREPDCFKAAMAC
jgi:hypothetical protein